MTSAVKKDIAILGSTGSIGQQALEVIRQHKERFRVSVLTAWNNASRLIDQANEFCPSAVVIGNDKHFRRVKRELSGKNITVLSGPRALTEVIASGTADDVLSATVGLSGLESTLEAVRQNKTLLLANKEVLAVGGKLIMEYVNAGAGRVIPIDSEHSAIFQCLAGETGNLPEKIYLTASGGPFLDMPPEKLRNVQKEDALKHPNWDMGDKTTIDSATMMNKGLEMMGACWLFGLKADQVEVVIHPQSIVHSMVQFADGSIKAQMGTPDMQQAIQYAMGYPKRFCSALERMDFSEPLQLEFRRAHRGAYRCLDMAYDAMNAGGNSPCVVNAANEIAVSAFLGNDLPFTAIPAIIEQCLAVVPFAEMADSEAIADCNRETRAMARGFVKTKQTNKR